MFCVIFEWKIIYIYGGNISIAFGFLSISCWTLVKTLLSRQNIRRWKDWVAYKFSVIPLGVLAGVFWEYGKHS